ncbi:hypothetical protein CO179_01340 [candidate division WWE3 bacterium CG_4_9_14_3_um_filter_39_7]|uniref:Bacterial sugar transferase domain-containing protein n=1 Tax=candidate division WWE3 bacterium CG_4_9_14_3_um_filter_39_7 TaxID=1975080 RepID=A0A2M7X3R4_UNCKA|nr:MAG: hypothetical protein CO179_01340 [candidate division WWE3 bacterium CG_4_9_14_3_um_filter_39_7]
MRRSKLLLGIITLVTDYVLVVLSYVVSYYVREKFGDAMLIPFMQFVPFALMAGFLYISVFAYFGLYKQELVIDRYSDVFRIVFGSLLTGAFVGSVIYFSRTFDYSRLVLGFSALFSVVFLLIGRGVMVVIERVIRSRGFARENVVIVGAQPHIDRVKASLEAVGENIYNIKAIYITQPSSKDSLIDPGLPEWTYNFDSLEKYLIDEVVHVVIIADPAISDSTSLEIFTVCEGRGIAFMFVPNVLDLATAHVKTHEFAATPLIELSPSLLDGWMLAFKRLLDVFISVVSLIFLSPLMACTAIAIHLDSKGPVLFRHRRVGRNGLEFDLIKFRSMSMFEKDGKFVHASQDEKTEKLKEEQPNYKLAKDPRVTKVGSFIRRTSIDELPQLINVLKGEISIVGPRAYVVKELQTQQNSFPQTKALVRRLLTVKPGITGLWQVSGRSNVDFTERVSMDAYYATHASVWLDIKILFRTIPVVLKGSGAM